MSEKEDNKQIVGEIKSRHGLRGFFATQGARTIGGLKTLPKKSRRGLLIAIVIMFVGGVVGIGWYVYHQTHKPVVACSDELIQQAAVPINNNNVKDFTPIVNKVKAQKNYQKDPNCLNIVTTYYLYTGDYNNAKLNLDILRKFKNPQFSKLLGRDALDMNALNQRLDIVKKQYENFQQSLTKHKDPPPTK